MHAQLSSEAGNRIVGLSFHKTSILCFVETAWLPGDAIGSYPKIIFWLTALSLYLLMPSADDFCKQFGPRSGPTERLA